MQKMWANVKTAVHSYLSSSEVTVAGDGRNSPGRTAHYCIYTLMEGTTKMVVDIEVIDKRETNSLFCMTSCLSDSRDLTQQDGRRERTAEVDRVTRMTT